jgi:6-phosphogluconolactonase (cycloisomerase 2 family)
MGKTASTNFRAPSLFAKRRLRPARRGRVLRIEGLETRQLLSAAPVAQPDSYSFHGNQAFVLDVPVTQSTTSTQLSQLQQVDSVAAPAGVTQLAYSKPYDQICALIGASQVDIVDGTTGAIVSTLEAQADFSDMDVTPDGRYLFVADYGGTIIGYGEPSSPSYVDRYDFATHTWQTKQAPKIAYKIQAVSDTQVLLQEEDQWVAITLNDFGQSASDPMTELFRSSDLPYPSYLAYEGSFVYDYRTARLYHGDMGAVYDIEAFSVNGNEMQSLGDVGDTPDGGGSSLAVSADGKYLFYGNLEYDALSLTQIGTMNEAIFASAGNVAFGSQSFYNAITDVSLGSLPFSSSIYAVSKDGQDVWACDSTAGVLHHYRTPGSLSGVLANDSDPSGAPMTAALVSGPAHGSLALHADGTFAYTPSSGFHGTDSFTYQAVAGGLSSAPATVTLNVYAANVPWTDYTTPENQMLSVPIAQGLLAGKTSSSGNTLQAQVVTMPMDGTLTAAADGSFTYTPNQNFHGVDRFSYSVADGGTLSVPIVVSITVTEVPIAPVASSDSYTCAVNSPFVVDAPVTQSTTSVQLSQLQQIDSIAAPAGVAQLAYSKPYDQICARIGTTKVDILDGTTGAVVSTLAAQNDFSDMDVTPDGRYLFVADYGGTIIGYGEASSPSYVDCYDFATHTWQTKQAPNIAWKIQAVSDAQVLLQEEDQWVAISLNDFGQSSSDPMTELSGTTDVSYPNRLMYEGSFVYDYHTGRIYHGDTGSSSQEIEAFSINGNQFQFLGNTGIYGTAQGGGPNLALSPDGQYLFYGNLEFDALSLAKIGTMNEAIFASAGNLAYGSQSFYNAITGVTLGSLPFSSSIYAVSKDGQDVWACDSTSGVLHHYRTPGSLPGVLANDSDPNGDPMTATLVSGPAHGSVTLHADGSFLYTPAPGFRGTDSFQYEANIGSLSSNVATVTLNVILAPQGPVGTSGSVLIRPGLASALAVANFGFTDQFDSPPDTFVAVEITTLPTCGTLSLAGRRVTAGQIVKVSAIKAGQLVYSPPAQWTRHDSFTFQVEGSGKTASTAVLDPSPKTLTFDAASISSNCTFTSYENQSFAVPASSGVLSHSTNPDHDPLTAVLVTGPKHGTLTLNADGSFQYTPTTYFVGSDMFRYTANDGFTNGNTATVTLNVAAVSQAPSGANAVASVAAGSRYALRVSDFGFSDRHDSPSNVFVAVEITALPTCGTLTLGGSSVTAGQFVSVKSVTAGQLVYTAPAQWTRHDGFLFQVEDSGTTFNGGAVLDPSPKTLAFDLAPKAVADQYSTSENSALAVTAASGVLENDSDADNDPLIAILVTGPKHGSLTLDPAGSFFYTPNAGYSGNDSFIYKDNDGFVNGNPVSVSIAVAPAPVSPTQSRAATKPTGAGLPGAGLAAAWNWNQPSGPSTVANLLAARDLFFAAFSRG